MAKLITDSAGIREIVTSMRRIGVLGIKTEAQRGQPSIEVPRYLQNEGFEVIPVPVYFPDVKEILGRPVYRTVSEIPGDVDVVNVFRRPKDLKPHLADLIAKHPKVVWLQLGISDNNFAKSLVEAGIDVVQNRCLLVEHQRFAHAG